MLCCAIKQSSSQHSFTRKLASYVFFVTVLLEAGGDVQTCLSNAAAQPWCPVDAREDLLSAMEIEEGVNVASMIDDEVDCPLLGDSCVAYTHSKLMVYKGCTVEKNIRLPFHGRVTRISSFVKFVIKVQTSNRNPVNFLGSPTTKFKC